MIWNIKESIKGGVWKKGFVMTEVITIPTKMKIPSKGKSLKKNKSHEKDGTSNNIVSVTQPLPVEQLRTTISSQNMKTRKNMLLLANRPNHMEMLKRLRRRKL